MSSHTNEFAAQRKQAILDIAFWEGTKWGVGGFLVAGAATLLATQRSKKFDKMTSVSAKMSIPVMTSMGLWSFKHEVVAHDAQMKPEKYGLLNAQGVLAQIEAKKRSALPVHHQAINYIYDHPFQMIATLATPLVGAIALTQSHNTHLSFSQKVMHSRVFAQAGILTILLTTMAFREYMDRNGRFEEPGVERQGIATSYGQTNNKN